MGAVSARRQTHLMDVDARYVSLELGDVPAAHAFDFYPRSSVREASASKKFGCGAQSEPRYGRDHEEKVFA